MVQHDTKLVQQYSIWIKPEETAKQNAPKKEFQHTPPPASLQVCFVFVCMFCFQVGACKCSASLKFNIYGNTKSNTTSIMTSWADSHSQTIKNHCLMCCSLKQDRITLHDLWVCQNIFQTQVRNTEFSPAMNWEGETHNLSTLKVKMITHKAKQRRQQLGFFPVLSYENEQQLVNRLSQTRWLQPSIHIIPCMYVYVCALCL